MAKNTFSSAHSLLERVQHAIVPNRSVRPLLDGWRRSGGGSPEGHCRQSLVRWFGHHAFIFLRPFAPPVLTGFNATMDALTPVPGSGCLSGTGFPVSFVAPSVHSAANHPLPSRCAIWGFLTSGLPSSTPLKVRRVLADHASWASPLASRLATATSRIAFAAADRNQPLLRTGRSPPVAPHPVSRRRSYHRLRGTRHPPTRTFTSPMQKHYRRTNRRSRTPDPLKREWRNADRIDQLP